MSDKQLKRLGMCGALFAMFAVMIGAFAAHGLKSLVDANAIETIKTAVFYQFIHSLAVLIIVALAMSKAFNRCQSLLRFSALSMLMGCILFSGSLYCLALTKIKIFGPITPMGGVAFIVGWVCLFMAFRHLSTENNTFKSKRNSHD